MAQKLDLFHQLSLFIDVFLFFFLHVELTVLLRHLHFLKQGVVLKSFFVDVFLKLRDFVGVQSDFFIKGFFLDVDFLFHGGNGHFGVIEFFLKLFVVETGFFELFFFFT